MNLEKQIQNKKMKNRTRYIISLTRSAQKILRGTIPLGPTHDRQSRRSLTVIKEGRGRGEVNFMSC